jgi:tRNA(Ile)-lysidine synthase
MGKQHAMEIVSPEPTSDRDARPPFVAAVERCLPASDFWTMPVLAAVSGGGDSVALLVALRSLVPPAAVHRLVVVHAEHDLRPDASDDRAFVERLAARLGLRSVARRLAIRPQGGEGIEAAARRQRYDFLAETAADEGARYVLVAHTADDQAETILLRMLRGTGLAGLGGMAAARELVPGVSLLRPMLGLRRTEARRFLEHLGEAWRDDPTNREVRHARNFLRHEVLAACAAGPFPAAEASLNRLGRQAALVAGALASAAERLLEVHASRDAEGGVVIRTRDLAGLDRHLVAEMFAALWRREGWPRRGMTARHYTGLAALALGAEASPAAGRSMTLPTGIQARLGEGGLLAVRPAR